MPVPIDIIKYYVEISRLKKAFPNLDGITYLKYLVRGVDCCSPEKPIAYQYDNHCKIIFEEHDVSGTISTDIIPITYHSSYANAIALQLKETMKNYPDFFRTFLEDYDEIIIDKDQESCEGALVFKNYLRCSPRFGLTLKDTIKGILSDKYTLDERKYSRLTSHFSLKKVKKDLNYWYLLQSPDFDDLFSSLLDSKQYQELKLLLDQQESIDTYLEEFKKRHVFDIINQEVDNFYNRFGITDFKLINDALEYARNNYKFYERDLSGFQQVSRDLVIDLTLKFLDTIDDTHALSKEFQETLDEKKTVLWYPSEKEQVEEFYKQQNYDYNNDIDEAYYSPYYDRINIPLTGTIHDVICTVHEFMHHHSLHKCSTLNNGLLKEVICIYFEMKAAHWLVEQGFKEEECFEDLVHRQAVDFWNNAFSGTALVFDLIKRKQQYGTLTVDNFADEKSLGVQLLMYLVLNHPEKIGNIEQTGWPLSNEEREAAINELAMNNVNELLNTNPVKVTNYLSYALGTYLADKSISSDMDARMMFVADNLSNPEYSDLDLFKHIQEGYRLTSIEKLKKM